jgi:hypothetical protein
VKRRDQLVALDPPKREPTNQPIMKPQASAPHPQKKRLDRILVDLAQARRRPNAAPLYQMRADLDLLLDRQKPHLGLAFPPRQDHGDGVGRRVVYRSASRRREGPESSAPLSCSKTNVRSHHYESRQIAAS